MTTKEARENALSDYLGTLEMPEVRGWDTISYNDAWVVLTTKEDGSKTYFGWFFVAQEPPQYEKFVEQFVQVGSVESFGIWQRATDIVPKPKEPVPMKCIVCSHSCEVNWDGAKGHNVPSMNDGVVCFTSGNDGSSLYDSFGESTLRFAVCDKCLVKKSADILYIDYSVEKTIEEHERMPFMVRLRQQMEQYKEDDYLIEFKSLLPDEPLAKQENS